MSSFPCSLSSQRFASSQGHIRAQERQVRPVRMSPNLATSGKCDSSWCSAAQTEDEAGCYVAVLPFSPQWQTFTACSAFCLLMTSSL